jgi:chemotaxis protein MotA
MDLSTVVGTVLGFGLLAAVGIMTGGLLLYWDLTSLIVVLGGATAATIIKWPFPNFMNGVKAAMKSVMLKMDSPVDLIEQIVTLADTARKESVLALEKVQIDNKFLSKSVKYMVDGYDQAVISSILDVDISSMHQRHKDGRKVLEDMGEASPAFGMIGTVMGLIVIMANLSDPDAIGPGLAVALVTTLYGSLVANMVFIPLAAKLQFRSKEEIVNLQIIKQGVNSILAGENPRSIREKLNSFINAE